MSPVNGSVSSSVNGSFNGLPETGNLRLGVRHPYHYILQPHEDDFKNLHMKPQFWLIVLGINSI